MSPFRFISLIFSFNRRLRESFSALSTLPAPAVATVACVNAIATDAAAANRCPLILPPQPGDVQNITFKVIF
jgi:hypothetical protein